MAGHWQAASQAAQQAHVWALGEPRTLEGVVHRALLWVETITKPVWASLSPL